MSTCTDPSIRAKLAAAVLAAAAAGLGLALRGTGTPVPELSPAPLPGTVAPAASTHAPAAGTDVSRGAPARLSETGLYADAALDVVRPEVRPYAPQYPLWTDGAEKRRWIRLPEGARIDATDPEAWSFPAGTKLWKEFRFERRVETRYMERAADGSWIYATYVWDAAESDAVLAPPAGVRGACTSAAGTRHDVPSLTDCSACHDARPSRVLGFDALQLSPERDPAAPHARIPEPGSVDVVDLLDEGLLLGDRAAILAAARPIEAATPRERAVLGYFHGNCGGCHNGAGPLASLGLELAWRRGGTAPALRTALERPSRFQPTGAQDALRIAPGDPEHSVLYQRMASRFGALQMPPLGTHAVDDDALALVRDWIRSDLATDVVVVSELTR